MIMISQWLCEKRHCAFGLAWDSRASTEAEVMELGRSLLAGTFNPRCGICGPGSTLRVEHAATRFRTMEEANADLASQEAANIRTRRLFDELGISAEPVDWTTDQGAKQ